MIKAWHDMARQEYLSWQNQDRRTLREINRPLTDIDRNGYNYTGSPELLKGNLQGYWDVKIDRKNRIVFRIKDGILEITECDGHYENN